MSLDEKAWKSVKALFTAAQELDPSQRNSFLNASGSNPEIRAEVQRLLTEYDQAGDFLSNPPIPYFTAKTEAANAPLKTGAMISHYRIISSLGAGGMGEVYRAHDPRFGREVAIKILPPSFASDPLRLRRFQLEARAIGTLNHPNILSIYDVGDEGPIHFLVTELLEGETLRSKLQRGPIPVRRASDYAVQLAQGLAAAHEKAIIHRDLKPENLFVTRDDRAKILDFGLAKSLQYRSVGGNKSTTVASISETVPGMVMGTAAYMAPEQVRGEMVDHRADLFAFGAVLYEMLSGRRAFQSSSSVETMSSILNKDPVDLDTEPEGQIPLRLHRIVVRCMEKNREQRFQSARDLAFALQNVFGEIDKRSPPTGTLVTTLRWRVLALLSGILAAAALGFSLFRGLTPSQTPEYHDITSRTGFVGRARFLPEVGRVIYHADWDTSKGLYTARSDGKDARRLDLPDCELLSISRSGQLAVSLKSHGERGTHALATVPLLGGAPRALLDDVDEADWSPQGDQLAISRMEAGQRVLEYPIGNRLYATAAWIADLRVSPQGDAIAFQEHPLIADDRGSIVMVDRKGKRTVLSHEWYGTQGLAWSPDGREIWFTATDTTDSERALYAVTRSGKQRVIVRVPGGLYLEDISADGRVLLARHDRRYEVVGGKIGGTPRLLSWTPILIVSAISQDGQYAVVGDWSDGMDYDVYLAKLDGSPPVLLGRGVAGSISPDNKLVTSILPTNKSKILLLPVGAGAVRSITAKNFEYKAARWTSDGRRLFIKGNQIGERLRYWIQDLSGGSPQPVVSDGVGGVFVSVNGSDYLAQNNQHGQSLYPIDGGPARHVRGLTDADAVIGGSPTSDILYVASEPAKIPVHVIKLNLTTGLRQPFVELSPLDPRGIRGIFDIYIAADGEHYVFTQVRELSVLYLAEHLK